MSFWTNPGQSLSNFDPGPGLGNFFSSVDPGPALGKTFASLDPGPMIGNLGVQIDKGVQDNIPGGWATIGALAATVATMGAASGMLAADLAVESTVIMEDGTVLTTFVDGTTAATTLDGATTLTAASGEPLGLLNTSVSAIPTADVTTGATLTDSATAINSGTATAASGGVKHRCSRRSNRRHGCGWSRRGK